MNNAHNTVYNLSLFLAEFCPFLGNFITQSRVKLSSYTMARHGQKVEYQIYSSGWFC